MTGSEILPYANNDRPPPASMRGAGGHAFVTKAHVQATRLSHAMLLQTRKNDEVFGRPLKPDIVEKTTWFVVAGLARPVNEITGCAAAGPTMARGFAAARRIERAGGIYVFR